MINVNLCGVELDNPIIAASGCFGFGMEFRNIFNPNELGAITLKSLSKEPKEGNHLPRVAEAKSGMLNAIGLENPGIEYFTKYILQGLKKNITSPIIANINGKSVADYVDLVKDLSEREEIQIIELNASCPNVAEGMAFGTNEKLLGELVSATKKVSKKPLFIKLSPNVTDIKPLAKVAEAEGIDGFSLINTIRAMRINIHRKKPILSTKIGGLSGSAIMPIALRFVYEVRSLSSLPIIGMGGIDNYEDVIEFMLAGANAVAIGAGFFKDPLIALRIKHNLLEYCALNNLSHINDIVGLAHNA